MARRPEHPAPVAPERDIVHSRRRPPRRGASRRALRLAAERIKSDLLRADPTLDDARAGELAAAELERQTRRNPRVERAMVELAPLVELPSSDQAYRPAELAAAAAQPEMALLLREMALTTGERGPAPDLSGAVGALVLMAFQGGAAIARSAFGNLDSGSVAWRWALAHPDLPAGRSACYRQLVRVTGRDRVRGHDPALALAANAAMIRRLAGTLEGGERVGRVASIDGTRLRAPVAQHGINTPGYMEALRRADMGKVAVSTYRRDGRSDTVVGWKAMAIVDQATRCPLAWHVGPASAPEPHTLTDALLPLLFDAWPGCPLETAVLDAGYDTEPLCQELVERYAIQPIVARQNPRQRTITTGGRDVEVVDGRPRCACGPMRFGRRDGFVDLKRRARLGLERGEALPPGAARKARVRWVCPHGLCRPVDLLAHHDYRDHTYWPRDPASRQGALRRAHELTRNTVESAFSVVKHNGIGTRDHCPLWAQDAGIEWLLALHCALRTARTLAHATGDYQFLHDEYQELGLHAPGHPPGAERFERAESNRPGHLRWRWPDPGRA